jgi:hypothetical protein
MRAMVQCQWMTILLIKHLGLVRHLSPLARVSLATGSGSTITQEEEHPVSSGYVLVLV